MIKKGKKKKCNQLERIHFPLGYTIHVDCLSDFMLVSLLFIYLFILLSHLGIRLGGNPPSQKALLLYEGVGSIPGVFKYTCVCVSVN